MITLLVVIFTAFVGLGLPDSMTGSAWPAIYQELGVSSSLNYCLTMPVTACSIMASLASGRLLEKFGTFKVAVFSTLLTSLGILGIYFSHSLVCMSLCGIALGFGAGAIDSGLNAFVAEHYSASVMSYLHCSYGIGVAVSPFIISIAIKNGNWRNGYLTLFFIQIAITAVIALSAPLWKKYETPIAKTEKTKEITTKELLKTKCLFPVLGVYFFACALEFLIGSWLPTYLVTQKEIVKETAAKVLSVYYVGLTSGRFLSGVFVNKLGSKRIIVAAFCFQAIAVVLLFTPFSAVWFAMTIAFFAGLGVGPIFPNYTHLTPEFFGEDRYKRVIGLQNATSNAGILLVPFLYGLISSVATHAAFPYVAAVTYSAVITLAIIVNKRIKKKENE